MKNRCFLFGSLVFVALLNSCKKDTFDGRVQDQDQRVILQQDAQALQARVSHSNVGLVGFKGQVATVRFRSGFSANATQETPEFSLALIAEVLPPTVEGKLLRATHVAVADNFAYVSYNTEGDTYLGGVDVIDISDVNNPILKVNAQLPHVDISAITVDGSDLLMAGAADVDYISEVKTPAFGAFLPLQAGLPTMEYQLTSLPGQVATDLTVDATHKYIVTGNNGVLAKINKFTHLVEKQIAVPALLSVTHNVNHIVALSASEGILVFDKGLEQLRNISSETNDSESKRTIELYGDYVLAAEGQKGLGIYNYSTGALYQRLAVPTVEEGGEGLSPEDLATIAVSTNGDRMFVASGGAGVAAYRFGDNAQIDFLGNVNLKTIGEGSNNYVLSKGNHVFVASGKGGLKILKMIELKPETPTCNGTYPAYTGNTQYDLNVNEAASYSDSKMFLANININRNFDWCGSLQVNGTANVNGGSIFNMYGSLMIVKDLNVNATMNINGASTVNGKIAINGGATLAVNGSLSQGSSGNANSFHVNGTMKVDGEVVIYGDLTINGGGKIEFANSNSKVTVYGKLTNWGTVVNGSVTKI